VRNDPHALIPDEAYDALLDAGVTVAAEVRDDGQVDVVVDVPREGSPARPLALEVRRYTRALTPGAVVAAAERRAADRPAGPDRPRRGLLLIAPAASAESVRQAADLGVSIVALDRRTGDGVHGHLAFGPGDVVPLGTAATVPASGGRGPGSSARGELQIVKAVLLLGGRTQKEIAGWASVSQPRVSQVLKRLAEQGLVRSAVVPADGPGPPRRAWTVLDADRLLRRWLAGYAGPGGVTTYWYGLDAPVRQVHAALDVLGAGRRVLVSGTSPPTSSPPGPGRPTRPCTPTPA
jgi:hypothetical protein